MLLILAALTLLCFFPAISRADDTGVLSETELNAWVKQVLRDSLEEQPMNAPVGEESLTEDGYAFLYSFATLYYDKPTLDGQSVLKGIAVTGEEYASPRGVKLGDDAQRLVESYGWQNPGLVGNGLFAAFYRLNDLPRAAYWCWAQHDGPEISSVQCAIHVQAGQDRYTDAGLIYTLENGRVTEIRAYGLSDVISPLDVKKNLDAVMGVEAAGSGDEPEAGDLHAQEAEGYFATSDQAPFSANDLRFGGIDYLALTEEGAAAVFSGALSEQRVQDDTGAWLLTTNREGLTLSYTVSADGAQSRLESMSATRESFEGPRGVRIGAALEDVLAAFQSDGEGRVLGGAAILYGDGVNAPTGVLERLDGGVKELRYMTRADQYGVERDVTLNMTFLDDKLTELMIYSW